MSVVLHGDFVGVLGDAAVSACVPGLKNIPLFFERGQ